jgi:hypothetical protein
MTHIARSFDTFGDFLEFVTPVAKVAGVTSRDDRDFYGNESFDEVLELAKRGWPEGAKRAAEIRGQVDSIVNDTIRSHSAEIGWDVSGEFLDVGRFLSGEPECFGLRVPSGDSGEKPVVKIVVNLAVSGAVGHDAIFARGAAIVAAIDILEGTGRRVEVWAAKGGKVARGRGLDNTIDVRTLVKPANQPLDIDRLAFVCCHTGCLRRLFFSAQEHCGYPATRTYPHAIDCQDAIVTGHALRGSDFTKEELIEYIDSICKQAGVSIAHDVV